MKFRIIFLFLFFASFLYSQTPVNVTVKSKNEAVFKVEQKQINDGLMEVSVIDENGEQITGLLKEDFSVLKKNKKANILYVKPLKDVSVTKMRVLLLIDNSASMDPFTKNIVLILDTLIASLGKGVVTSVAVFDERFKNQAYIFKDQPLPIRISPFSKDDLKIKSVYQQGFRDLSARTFLYDEIYAGLKLLQNDTTKVERNFVIVFSDGADLGSSVDQNTILGLNFNNISFYNIDFMHSAGGEEPKPNSFLKYLAKKTGGDYYSPKDVTSLSSFFRAIATKIEDKGYQVAYEFPSVNPNTTFAFQSQSMRARSVSLASFNGLVVEEVLIKESFPLLNYIFFNSNSDTLLPKYLCLKDSNETKTFSESAISDGALEHYYNILNIVGERLVKFPESKISLVGCSDGTEKTWKILNQNRIDIIKNYFERIWKISPDRITTGVKNLPDKASNSKTDEGKEENRRVEIVCNDWQILKPVTYKKVLYELSPSSITFNLAPDGKSTAQIEKWELTFIHGAKEWRRMSGTKENANNIIFDWKNLAGEIPLDTNEFTVLYKLEDNGGDVLQTTPQKIPVKQIKKEKEKNEGGVEGRSIEKVSLVLFDFAKSDLTDKNDSIMGEFVYPRLQDSTYVIINGYTDNSGTPEVNLKLSQSRAKAVNDILVNKIAPNHLFYFGFGASRPIFSNLIPEGRFYNRTVKLTLQNFRPELTEYLEKTPEEKALEEKVANEKVTEEKVSEEKAGKDKSSDKKASEKKAPAKKTPAKK